MSKVVEINRIVLKIGQKEIPLSLSEAKELQDILNTTFGNTHPYPVWVEYPVYKPYTTWEIKPKWDTGTVYCSSTSAQATM
jgi:hypothetical protein